MAAREDQPQPIVGDRHVRLPVAVAAGSDGLELRLDREVARKLVGLLAQPAPPTQTVDRTVARGRRDPRPGVRRYAAIGPDLERGDEGFLDRFLSEVEVAEDADQRCDRASLLLAEDAVDEVVSGGVALAQPAAAPTD
jgi:hypothetical protein